MANIPDEGLPTAPDLSVWRASELPTKSAVDTPSPLREIYDAVADAVFHAWEARYAPTFDAAFAFKEGIALPLANSFEKAHKLLEKNRSWLRVNAPEPYDAFQAAMKEARAINDACGHVVLRVTNASPTAYMGSQEPFDAANILGGMDAATCQASVRLLTLKATVGDPEIRPAANLSFGEQAIILLKRNGSLSDKEIALKLECHPSTLAKAKSFQRFRQAMRAKVPKGRKSKDGTIEADDE